MGNIKYPPISYDFAFNKRGGLKRTNFWWSDENGNHIEKMSRKDAALVNKLLPQLPRTRRELEEQKRRSSGN